MKAISESHNRRAHTHNFGTVACACHWPPHKPKAAVLLEGRRGRDACSESARTVGERRGPREGAGHRFCRLLALSEMGRRSRASDFCSSVRFIVASA